MGLDWKPIINTVRKEAEQLGHKIGRFDRAKTGIFGGSHRMVACETCCGCMWVAHTARGKFRCGGRLLMYRCGTQEAQGFKSK